MKKTNIAIVGAGLVGSLLAIFLAKKGHQISVYERRQDMRKLDLEGGRSINLALSDRGWRALQKVGLGDAIRQIAIPMTGRMVHYPDGKVALQPYGKEGQAIYSVSRAELNRIMMDKSEVFPNVDFYFDKKCEKIDLKANKIHIKNNLNNSPTETIQPDLIFGADGAFSAVRSSMQRSNRFNYSQHFLKHAYKELRIPPTADGGWRISKNALHIWPRKSFMLIALPNLDGSFTCTLFLAYEGAISFEQLETKEAVISFFETYFPDALAVMPDLVEDFFTNPTASLVTVRCDPWVKKNPNGQVALIGDASHAIVPFYGQGMNAGLEDCYVLNELLEKSDNWSDVLEDFQASRIPDADAIADLALRNFIEMRDLVADEDFLLRKKIEKQIAQKYPKTYVPLYSMVTFSPKIRYSEALELSKAQDIFFDRLFEEGRVAERWEAGELDDRIADWVADLYQKSL